MRHNDPDLDRSLLDLAEGQHGLVARHQVSAIGLSRSAWAHRCAGDRWERLSVRVARRPGSPPTTEQSALAAVLDMGPDAYLSHQSAAALWGVPGFEVAPIQVMVVRGHRTASTLATVHHPRHLTDPFSAVLAGIPIVRPALLVLQLAALVHPGRLERVFDGLWSRGLLSAPSVRAELAPVLGRGRAGSAVMRELLDRRPADYVPPASGLEARFAQIVRDFDLPPMRRQVDLGDGERWCGRVDFVARELRLIVEVDSDRYHSALTDVEADAARRGALEVAGFTFACVREFDVWHRPARVAAQVRRAITEARRAIITTRLPV
jgi:very-short-patch-repair endonuclease